MSDRPLSEGRIQQLCFEWHWNNYPNKRRTLFSVPNEAQRSMVTASRLKGQGLVAGIPDLILVTDHGAFGFEFKKPGQRQSAQQKKVEQAWIANGISYHVVTSEEQFKELIVGIYANNLRKLDLMEPKAMWDYRKAVYDHLFKMDHGRIVPLTKLCKEETKQRFITVVKDFITFGYPKANGFELLFTEDYSGIYKFVDGKPREIANR